MNKLKDVLNNLGNRVTSNEEHSVDNEEKIAALQARLAACEAERDMSTEQLERITTRLNILERILAAQKCFGLITILSGLHTLEM